MSNDGVARYRGLANRHLVAVEARAVDPETILLEVETNQSHIRVAEAARTRLLRAASAPVHEPVSRSRRGSALSPSRGGKARRSRRRRSSPSTRRASRRSPTRAVRLTARWPACLGFDELLVRARPALGRALGSVLAELEGREELASSGVAPPHLPPPRERLPSTSSTWTPGCPPAAWPARPIAATSSGTSCSSSRSSTCACRSSRARLLRYRYRRLDAARGRPARRDTTARCSRGRAARRRRGDAALHLNPRSGRWIPDNSHLQRHISAAVAYNVWQYYQATGDIEFLAFYGAEMLLEIARFWASIATFDQARGRYVIRGVMGPDEYHDAYPGSERPGIDNNAYTNVMAAWVLLAGPGRARRAPRRSAARSCRAPRARPEELERWEDVSRRMLRPVPRRRDHQPVRGLRGPRGARLGGLPRRSTRTSSGSTGSWRPRATAPTATRPPSRRTC